MKNKKLWLSADIKSTDLVHLGFKEINKLDASRKFPENINIFLKFFYHDAFRKTLVESPLFFLDKLILKNLESINRSFEKNKNQFSEDTQFKLITTYSAFDYLFMKIKIQEIFPHTIMSSFIYTDNRTKTPVHFVEEKIVPPNKNQSYLTF